MAYQDALSLASTAAMADIANSPAPAPESAPAAPPAAPPSEAAPPLEAAPPSTPPVAEVPPTPDTTQPVAAAETTPPAPTEESGGGQKWTFTRKGQQVEVTDPTQALELIRKGYDYTEKTMELATQRRAFEEQLAATRAWMQDPANLRQVLAHLEGQQAPPAAQPHSPAAPDDLATHQDLQRQQQQLAAQLQATQQQTAQMIQASLLKAETDRYTQEYKAEVNKTLSTLYDTYPLLKEVEKVEKLILDDVSEQIRLQVQEHPENVVSIDEVKVLLAQNAKRRHDRLDAKLKDFRKMEVVRQAKLTTQGAEPPGGAPPAPPPPKAYKLGDPALTADVIRELQQAFDSKR